MTLLDELDAATLALLTLRFGRRRARRLLSAVSPVHAAASRACLRDVLAGQPSIAPFAAARRQGGWLRELPRDPDRQGAWLQSHCAAHGIDLLGWNDPAFPEILRQIPDPPLALYLRGRRQCLVEPAVALVGARRATRHALELSRQLAASLCRAGIVVVSGLAIGCDAAAHQGALDSGRTVAVLGSGLARISPPRHLALASAILDAGGALVSEYPPLMAAERHHFPERNRLISGLCRGVVVVEAGARSGSLITARFAAEQGREVLAVPGSVAGGCNAGGHQLLRDGAALVETAADVLDALGWTALRTDLAGNAPAAPEDPRAARLLSCLAGEPLGLDALTERSGLAVSELAALLVDLELDGFVHRTDGGYIRRPFES